MTRWHPRVEVDVELLLFLDEPLSFAPETLVLLKNRSALAYRSWPAGLPWHIGHVSCPYRERLKGLRVAFPVPLQLKQSLESAPGFKPSLCGERRGHTLCKLCRSAVER